MRKNWYVITGGPGAGKTTTINLLKDKGYTVIPESARAYYEEHMAKGLTNEQIRMNDNRQAEISRRHIETENALDPQETIFFDRGIPDGVGYFEFLKLSMPDYVYDAYKKSTYGKVFFLEQLPHVQDEVRTESDEEALEISKIIHKKYRDINVEIIHVPVMEKEARVQFILDHINT